MCDPVSASLMVAGSLYGLYGQRKSAKQAQRFADRNAQAQQDQIQQSNSAKANNRAQQARAERARLRALSAETGLTGASIDSVVNNADTQAGLDISTIELNRDNAMDNSVLQHQSNLNAIRQPDYLGTALNLGLSLASAGAARNTPTGSNGGAVSGGTTTTYPTAPAGTSGTAPWRAGG